MWWHVLSLVKKNDLGPLDLALEQPVPRRVSRASGGMFPLLAQARARIDGQPPYLTMQERRAGMVGLNQRFIQRFGGGPGGVGPF